MKRRDRLAWLGSLCNHGHTISNKQIMKLLFFLLLLIFFDEIALCTKAEEFSEELLLRPLPDGKVLAHFQFTHRLPPLSSNSHDKERHHHRLFPKSIYQLIQKFQIQEMELSFTQGRWNYNQWGGVDPVTRLNAKPSGVELWAEFAVPDREINSNWGNLTHALSGLFCASLNFLESPLMTANPVRAFKRKKKEATFGAPELREKEYLSPSSSSSMPVPHPTWEDDNVNCRSTNGEPHGQVRYGALPREAVCTENLTPWLKLLPCRDKAGFATLLDRPTIYKSWYHSLRLHVTSDEFDGHVEDEHKGGTLLQQTLTLVIQPASEHTFPWHQTGASLQPSWSLSTLFGRDLTSGGCPLAMFSTVYLEFEGSLMKELKQHRVGEGFYERNGVCTNMPGEGLDSDSEQLDCITTQQKVHNPKILSDFKNNNVFTIHGIPHNIVLEIGDSEKASLGILLVFTIPDHEDISSGHIGLTWKIPFSWTTSRGPFRATRFLVGNGNARGAIALVLKSNKLKTDHRGLIESASLNTENVVLFQVVPWYIRMYLHTLKVFIDKEPMSLREVVRWMHMVPSEDRKSPGVMEMELAIPSNATIVTLIMEFDKGFLRIDEHPPDANRGFDLPSALLDFSSQSSARMYYQHGISKNHNSIADSPLLHEFQREKSVQAYTEVLLVPLATPDFSMPYNVITLTCTVLALYFGSLLNILRRRIGEEERLMNNKEGTKVSRLEMLLSKILRRKPGTSPSRHLKLIKFTIVAVIAVVVNYFLAKS